MKSIQKPLLNTSKALNPLNHYHCTAQTLKFFKSFDFGMMAALIYLTITSTSLRTLFHSDYSASLSLD